MVSVAAFPTWGGLFVLVGFSAHTRGDSASVAPSPKPSAAARLLRSQGLRPLSSLPSTNWSSCHAGDARRAANCSQRERIARQLGVPGDRRLSGGLIRCNFGTRSDCHRTLWHGGSQERVVRNFCLRESRRNNQNIKRITTEVP